MEAEQVSTAGGLEKTSNDAQLENKNPEHCLHLGLTFHHIYTATHQQEYLEGAVLHFKTGLELGTGDVNLHGLLFNNLGHVLCLRHQQHQERGDLEMATYYYEQALGLYPLGDLRRASTLNNLASALLTKYNELGDMGDLEKVINCHEQALELHPLDNIDRSSFLNNLASALSTRYEQLGGIGDLEKAIKYHDQALELCPPGDLHRLPILNNLGLSLQNKFQQLGDIKDLERAIYYHEQALELHSPDSPDRLYSLNNLGLSLQIKYDQCGDMEDLEKTIKCHELVLKLSSPGSHLHSFSLNNLASALEARYKQHGNMEDLEKTITCHEQALELRPYGNPFRASSLNNLASTLLIRYEQLGNIKDLERAIKYHELALQLRPVGNPERSSSLHNLANALKARYEQLGGIEDLQKTIAYCEQALSLRPPGHTSRLASLNNLATALLTRYGQLGDIEDLKKGIKYQEQVLELLPSGNPLRPSSLCNFATALEVRYKQLGDEKDLDIAINHYKEALELSPYGNILRLSSLGKLGHALQVRYEQHEDTYKNLKDLEKAISYYKQALDLCPPGNPLKSYTLNNLGLGLLARYKQFEDKGDLEKSMDCHEQALELCPPGHPLRTGSLNNLGNIFYIEFIKSGDRKNLNKALTHYEQGALHLMSNLLDRLEVAKHWAIKAHKHNISSAVTAYSLALDLQQQHLAFVPSITSQQKLVEKSSQLSLDAASCAISTGRTEIAIQLLEQGRSILWSKLQAYRQPFDEISEKSPQLAKELQAISKQLEQNMSSSDPDITLQHSLSEKWTALLGKIRKLDGFSDYLQATPFHVLQKASAEGPVIMVNISNFRSDALILVSHGSPVVVPLPDASPQILKQLVIQLSTTIKSSFDHSKDVNHILRHLWHIIVKPVVDQLVQLEAQEKSHIWWCPTSYLCALPIHAAGPYTRGFKNLPDLYISSYTPTLGSLIRARLDMPKPQPVSNLLLVSQPDDTIPQVFEEIKVINSLDKQISSFSGQDADKSNVLAALQSHSWVHFACHGHLEAQPFDSWFQIFNKEHLTVFDLAMAKLPSAEFAFLSACHSAAGSVHGTPDESIHLAGALQFSGFKSVIGTMWAMVDDDGPPLAKAFYKYMFQDSNGVDLRDTAKALNLATKELRRQHVPVERWINFIHIGA